ncbi:hypothetical protein Tco_1110628 [Tanacetum coccineum]|uniref:Uncharacterized protein n=1 Tax=Tanacetum coccineum TaxID=301880 RepID=A0ABQ5IKT6_9ASTR
MEYLARYGVRTGKFMDMVVVHGGESGDDMVVIHFKKGIAKYAKVSSTHQKCLDLDSSSYFFQKIILL